MKYANEIIADAHAELNFRKRGQEARRARLEAADAPLNHAELKLWLAKAERQAAADAGAWFRAGSVRITNGGEPDLPTFGPFAPRIENKKFSVYYHDEAAHDKFVAEDAEGAEDAPCAEDDDYVAPDPFESGDEGWYWSLRGITSGGPFTSETEARESGEKALCAGGWTSSPAEAERLAIVAARTREEQRQNRQTNKFLIDWRKRQRLTQAAVAEILGVTKNSIARWERGELRMKNPQQVRLALEGAKHRGMAVKKS